MSKPVQYILCGLPFSGKTTLSKELQKKLGFTHINLDELKAKRGLSEVSDDDVSAEEWESIFAEADKMLVRFLLQGKSVVNETAWTTHKWRDRVRDIATRAGFPTKVIYINIPESAARKRWLHNKKTKKRYDTPDKIFEDLIKEFEVPTKEENLLLYDQTTSIANWIEKNF